MVADSMAPPLLDLSVAAQESAGSVIGGEAVDPPLPDVVSVGEDADFAASDGGLLVPPDLALNLDSTAGEGVEREQRWEEMFRGEPVSRPRGGGFFSRVRVDVDIAVEVLYDDNVLFARPGEEVADIVFRFRPGLVLAFGDAEVREASFLQLSYRPTGSVFVDLSSENSFDHDIAAVFGHRGPKLKTTFDASYRTITEATIDVSARTQRQIFDTGLLMEYALGAKTGLRGDAGYVVENFDMFAGSEEWQADLYLTYAGGGKSVVGIGYGGGELRPEGGRDQRYQRALLRTDWRVTEKFVLAAWGGADFRRTGAEQETTGVFGVEFGGRVRAGTGLRLSLQRGIEASALQQSESFVRTVFVVGVDQRLGRRFTALLDVGFEINDYATDGEEAVERADESWFVRPGIRYQFRENLSAEIYYAYRENASSIDLFDFKKNQIGASMRYDF